MASGDFRSPLARAEGLGSAKSGTRHWWLQRVSAIALVPLTVWFLAAIIAHAGADYATFASWLRTPVAMTGTILLLLALFHHSALGLQVIVEDYVHQDGAKLGLLILIRFAMWGIGAAATFAVLRIAV